MTAYPRAERRARKKAAKLTKAQAHALLPVLDAVIVAVDTGACSGWAVYERGALMSSGQCDVYSDVPAGVVSRALAHAKQMGLPCFLVCERPFAGNTASAAGMGAAFGVWKAAWYRAEGVKARLLRVYPSVWMARVAEGWVAMERDLRRSAEQAEAAFIKGAPVGDDEAPAIMIGQWAMHAPELAAKMPKRLRGAA